MCVKWFRIQYPNLCLFAVPNGANKSRTSANLFKKEGLLAGVSDLVGMFPNGKVVFFELKAPTEYIRNQRTGRMNKKQGGKMSEQQLAFFDICDRLGFDRHLIDSFEEFKKIVDFYACNNP